ncbi:zf-HC2 domain-containing protein [Microbacterium sp. SS28]|uniref:zf-HC2 domain-containing protein n=1 Tax=Microbacterium sp. SS28 TaxID=2919948 RepID=UPI001FA962B4|nr:zf-HC2 domain-containing protein [Microbacterium sp. SS28]
MNPDHPRFAEWDAAYALGALSPADRREFEEHVAECPECRRAVAELAPTAGLLSRLSVEDAERIDAGQVGPLPGADERPAEILTLARQRARRRRRTRIVAIALAAVFVVVAAIAVPFTILSPRAGETFALERVVDIPLEASVRLTSVDWGTRIELDCAYPEIPDASPGTSWTYALAVVDSEGVASTVSTWRAESGSRARLSAGTALDVGEIRSVEIRAMSGAVLMSYDLEK